ncbi:MAG: protein-L-isoaspartate(D-aspartate) O-methyltransferase [Anaerolineales bacterium]|nr:protein-L-isoaspartate(D-aspartate) O-methyltransferase [Anaerolineales bacterium]
MSEADLFADVRQRMVSEQMCSRDIRSPRVLQAMLKVPRHRFVPEDERHLAYTDAPLPIGHHQTISQPYIVALMTQLLDLQGDERVLEIGTGSGYQAAVLAALAGLVYSVERIPELRLRAQAVLAELGLGNVTVVEGDGTQGLPEHAPYQAILVTAAAPGVPEPLKRQLAEGGRLVLPVGGQDGQMLERWRRRGERYDREQIAPVVFVPLIGRDGWSSEPWSFCR